MLMERDQAGRGGAGSGDGSGRRRAGGRKGG